MKATHVIEAHSSYVLGLSFTQDSQTLVSAGMDNLVKLWSVPDWKLVRSLEGHSRSVNGLALSPDERVLATGSSDQTVKLWSFPDLKLLHVLQDRKKVVSAVQISPDGRWIGAASYGGRVMVWSLSGEEVVGIKASQKNLSSLAFSPDGASLATCGLGADIYLWSLPSGEHIGTLSGHQTAVMSLKYYQQGRRLVSLGYEGTLKFWDTTNWETIQQLTPKEPGLRGLTISQDEKTLALSLESNVQFWSLPDLALNSELPISTKVVNGMSFSPDGNWFAAGAADRKIRIWDRR